MSGKDLELKTKEELLDLAGDHGIPVTRSLLKREIVALLRKSLSKKTKKNKPAANTKKSPARTGASKSLAEKEKKKTPALTKTAVKVKLDDKGKRMLAGTSYHHAPHAGIGDMAQEAKFVLGSPQIRDEAQGETVQDLPSNYGSNKLVLIARDPYWVYSYWEIQQDRIEAGLRTLAKPHDEIRWTLRVHTLPSNTVPHPAYFDTEVESHVRTWYLHLTPCGASFYAEIGLKDRQNNFYQLAVSNRITLPLDRPSDVLDERWMTSDEEFKKLYALAGGFRVGVGSGSEAIQKEQPLSFGVSSGSFASSLFSPGKRQRKFWFWVDAELIVYGGTEPDAKVTLHGQRVKLRPDGTFTARFALPDGIQTIPVTAQSEDGVEIRTITPVVSRNTERPEPIITKEEE